MTAHLPAATAIDGYLSNLAAARACEADRRARLDPQVVDAITAAGFTRHFAAGGTFTTLFDAVADLAETCTSAAWCASLWATHARFAGYLSPPARDDIWAAGPDVRIGAALTTFQAHARRTDDDWILQGRWEFVSGADFTDWFLLSCPDPTDATVRVHLVPRQACTIERTWDTTGMRGTGSHTVVLAPTPVPGYRTMPLARILLGSDRPETTRTQQAPAQLAGGLLFVAAALGAARRTLALWAEQHSPGTGVDPAVGYRAGQTTAESAAHIDAAGALLSSAIQRADNDPINPALVARNHRDAIAALRLLLSAVDRLAAASGLSAQRTGDGINRRWRDVHTLSAHGALAWEQAAATYVAALISRPTP